MLDQLADRRQGSAGENRQRSLNDHTRGRADHVPYTLQSAQPRSQRNETVRHPVREGTVQLDIVERRINIASDFIGRAPFYRGQCGQDLPNPQLCICQVVTRRDKHFVTVRMRPDRRAIPGPRLSLPATIMQVCLNVADLG
jgi:hypothetical protein